MKKTNIKKITVVFILLFIATIIVLLKKYNPETSDFYPKCLIYNLIGFKCAGCGFTRATHYLLNLNFAKAFYYNPLIYFVIIYFVYYIIIYFTTLSRKDKIDLNNKKILVPLVIFLIITVIYMIIRNFIDIIY